MGSEYGSNYPTFTQRESCFSWTGCITTEKHGEGKHKKNPLKYSRFHAEEYSEPSLENDFSLSLLSQNIPPLMFDWVLNTSLL